MSGFGLWNVSELYITPYLAFYSQIPVQMFVACVFAATSGVMLLCKSLQSKIADADHASPVFGVAPYKKYLGGVLWNVSCKLSILYATHNWDISPTRTLQ